MKWESIGKSDIGRVRSGNEDAFFTDPDQGVFIVADGMGGHAAGEVASGIATEMVGPGIARALEQGLRGPKLEERIVELVGDANAAILERADSEPDKRGMGTTITLLALIPEGEYVIGQVGDSRCYLYRDGQLSQVTNDHTVVQQQVDRGALTADQARDHPLSHILTRALGTEDDVIPDTYGDAARPGDVFVLCSDGLSGMVRDEEIAEVVAAHNRDINRIADELINAANRAGGQDNVTTVVVRLAD